MWGLALPKVGRSSSLQTWRYIMNQQNGQEVRPFGRLVAREISQEEIEKLTSAASTITTTHMVGEVEETIIDL